MAINFKEVKEIAPWDKFSDECEQSMTDPSEIAMAYHKWLERKNPEIGACIVCERRFKPRISEKNE